MPVDVLMPALSPTMKSGKLVKWNKKEGDKVTIGTVIAEIETDKAAMDVEAVEDGVLAKIIVSAGTADVAVNSLIAVIAVSGESDKKIDQYLQNKISAKSLTAQREGGATVDVRSSKEAVIKETAQVNEALSVPVKVSAATASAESKRIKASPLAKRIAESKGIDLGNVKGSGPYGRIVKNDVLYSERALEAPAISRFPQTKSSDKIIKKEIGTMRRVIADRLCESKREIPHFYLHGSCVVDRLLEVRKEINAGLTSGKVTVNDMIVKAVALSLKDNPDVNVSWQNDYIAQYQDIDVAVAVGLDEGLITPVVRNVDYKSLTVLSSDIKALVDRARAGKLGLAEFQGGSITVSNLGMYGVAGFYAIINPPQSCILAVGAVGRTMVVCDEKPVMASVMQLNLSCDHRVIDGALGARFLQSISSYLENPLSMLV